MGHHPVSEKPSASKKTLSSYIMGLFLSLAITMVSFALVIYHLMSSKDLAFTIMLLAVLQLLAQVVFFLRMNSSSPEGKWTSMSFVFVILVVLIIVIGSLWIMHNLNYNMVN